MSDPPPPPQLSPDGKFWWDGQRWVPVQQAQSAQRPANVGCVTHTTCITVVALGVGLIVVLLFVGIISLFLSHH